jgi:preprotein translocase subunit Sss1
MDVSAASWLVIAIAIAAANLPFFNDKVFALLPTKWPRKPLFVRLLEMAVLYLVVGAIGFAIESQIGSRFPQTQEFYWIAAGLFIVLGFPGFIVRYLHKRHG